MVITEDNESVVSTLYTARRKHCIFSKSTND